MSVARIRSLWFACSAAASLSAAALDVGSLQLQRPAGQQAYAEITLSDSAPIDPATVRARVATPEGYRVAGMRYQPALQSLTMTPQAAPDGRVILRIDGLPKGSDVAELDLLLLVGDRVSLSLNEYRVDLRGTTREFAPAAAGTRLAARTGPPMASPSPATQAPAAARTPAPERAPVAAAASGEPALALDAATRTQIEEALAAWTKAWSARDVTAYLAAYVADYQPSAQRMSHAEWEKQRRARITAKQVIDVSLSEIELRRRGDTVAATFLQRYRGDSLVENGRKRVVFRREQDRWLIQEEVELR